ncbi:hypothetical protein WKV44_02030 [Spirochaetia bacterium 38H-sp]|uniref:GPI inositol-deacylase PGAP1-like alpha/beta domain-containing protein n=1 Tax=Rarispira pelagica TaxID=3141764 RepID=A0ABU9U9H2_9SPIR
MKKYKFWLINASVQLFSKEDSRKKLLSVFPNSEIATRKAKNHTTQNLMPDQEYFVPIPVKCLGYDLITPPSGTDEEVKTLLNNIKKQYLNVYKTSAPHEFWKQNRDVKMLTPEGKGYYRLIEEQSDKDTINILIGYSQGGLVARYLAFADKRIYKKRLISGLITISTPHYGSPVADPTNKERITDKLISIIYSLATLTPSRIPATIKYLQENIDFKDVQAFLSALMEDSKKNRDLKPVYGLVSSLNRWLSGLENNPDTAFFDLSPARFADCYSSLSLVNSTKQDIPMTSIISCNNSMDELIFSLLESKNSLIRILHPLYKYFLRHTRIMGMKLSSGIERAGIGYKELFIPYREPMSDKEKLAEKRYKNGIKEINIPAEAHDFIIPSAYQLIEKDAAEYTSIFINPYANHDSGKNPCTQAGKINIDFICYSLRQNKRLYT